MISEATLRQCEKLFLSFSFSLPPLSPASLNIVDLLILDS